MWDYIINNLPLVIILILAIVICGADLIKAIGVWKAKRKESIDEEVAACNEQQELLKTLKELKDEIADKLDGLNIKNGAAGRGMGYNSNYI